MKQKKWKKRKHCCILKNLPGQNLQVPFGNIKYLEQKKSGTIANILVAISFRICSCTQQLHQGYTGGEWHVGNATLLR